MLNVPWILKVSQHGRIKMKRMDSDLQWMNGNKSRSSIMESLSSLAVHPLQSLIRHPACINYSQRSPLSLTKGSNSAQELTRLRDFWSGSSRPRSRRVRAPATPQLLKSSCELHCLEKRCWLAQILPLSHFASSFAASEEEYLERGVSRCKWPHARSNWLEFCRPGFNPQIQHGLTG